MIIYPPEFLLHSSVAISIMVDSTLFCVTTTLNLTVFLFFLQMRFFYLHIYLKFHVDNKSVYISVAGSTFPNFDRSLHSLQMRSDADVSIVYCVEAIGWHFKGVATVCRTTS